MVCLDIYGSFIRVSLSLEDQSANPLLFFAKESAGRVLETFNLRNGLDDVLIAYASSDIG